MRAASISTVAQHFNIYVIDNGFAFSSKGFIDTNLSYSNAPPTSQNCSRLIPLAG